MVTTFYLRYEQGDFQVCQKCKNTPASTVPKIFRWIAVINFLRLNPNMALNHTKTPVASATTPSPKPVAKVAASVYSRTPAERGE